MIDTRLPARHWRKLNGDQNKGNTPSIPLSVSAFLPASHLHNAQGNWDKATSTWSEGHCISESTREAVAQGEMILAQGAWAERQNTSTSLAQLTSMASYFQTLLAQSAQPAQHGWWLGAIRHQRQQLKFCCCIRSPTKVSGK